MNNPADHKGELKSIGGSGERLAVIVDTETTGLDHRLHELIELGMVAFIHDASGTVLDVVGAFNAL